VRGKRKKRDVQEFQHALMDNVFALHRDLVAGTYKHGPYIAFKISDPKSRDIHKATVRDRLVHHAIYRQLYPFFDRTFIADSYSCRRGKGTHKAMNRFREFAYKVSKNHTRTAWVLKCDVRKFFASIDQTILMEIVSSYIPNKRTLGLVTEIVGSLRSDIPKSAPWRRDKDMGTGLPLGNLTSQLLVNAYINEFDQYVKHKLKAKYYIRYADDFVILSQDKQWLECLIPKIAAFLNKRLELELHPQKVSISAFASGIDFLGYFELRNSHQPRRVTHPEQTLRES